MTLRINPAKSYNLSEIARGKGIAPPSTIAISLSATVKQRYFTDGQFDLDPILFTVEGLPTCCRAISRNNIVYYQRWGINGGAIRYMRQSNEHGVDDRFHVSIPALPPTAGVMVMIDIHAARSRNQRFDMVRNARLGIEGLSDNTEAPLLELSFGDRIDDATTVAIGGIFRDEANDDLHFYHMDRGFTQGLHYALEEYGAVL